MSLNRKYFITTQLKTQLPAWFRANDGKKSITVLTIHHYQDPVEKERSGEVTVHSNIALQGNSEFFCNQNFDDITDVEEKKARMREFAVNDVYGFVCYSNEERLSKTFAITNHQFDEIEFWFVENGQKINNVERFRAELILEIFKS
jgi:hypothetical protein